MFDLLKFNNVNLDPLTETYNMAFYTQYLAKWPEYCFNVTAAQGRPMGYILGKAEGLDEEWHGHVTAVTVPPEYRRLGVAAQLMDMLERGSENARGYFVDISNPNPSRNPNLLQEEARLLERRHRRLQPALLPALRAYLLLEHLRG